MMSILRRCLSRSKEFYPAGHFYSPVPDFAELASREEAVFDRRLCSLPGIDLNDAGQVQFFNSLKQRLSALPFADHPRDGVRFGYVNDFFSYADAIVLASLLCVLAPKRLIEVGSGHSSAAILDVNEHLLNHQIECTFIEPYPKRLRSLCSDADLARTRLIETRLQDVDSSVFAQLEANDVLFIDSSHVCKTGSDVNRLFFEILPQLRSGVFVHIHDVFFPFEYPAHWVLNERRAWSESYLLRAFLSFNAAFRIRFWNDYFALAHRELIDETFPLWLKNTGGSIWIERV